MEIFGYLKVIIIAMFCALIVMVVLVPIMQTTNETPTYEENEPTLDYRFSHYAGYESVDVEIEITAATENYDLTLDITINGESYTSGQLYYIIWDRGIIGFRSGGAYMTYLQPDDTLMHARYHTVGEKFMIKDGLITIDSHGSYSISSPYSYVLFNDDSDHATYALYNTSEAFNISKNAELWTVYHTSAIEGFGVGTADHIVTGLINQPSNTYVWSATIDTEDPNDYYYHVTGASLTVTTADDPPTTTTTVTRCIAPVEYISGTEINEDLTHTMLSLLPLILLVAIIMAVVSAVVRAR